MEKLYKIFINIIDNFYNSFIYEARYKYVLEGLLNTIIMAVFAVIIGFIIGLIISIIRDYHEKTGKLRVLDTLSRLYVTVIRGTPALLQLMIIYYIIFKSVDVSIVLVGIISFGLNSGAYVSEIIRSGLNSVPKHQMDAGTALGFKYQMTMRYIILPQAIKNIMPALGNEFITLLKETSVAGYIGIIELTKAGDIIASRTYDYFFPLITTALIYLCLTLILSKLINGKKGGSVNA